MDKLTIFGVTKPVNQKTYQYGLNSFETDHRWHKEVMRLKKQYRMVKPGNEQGRHKIPAQILCMWDLAGVSTLSKLSTPPHSLFEICFP
jgi:hypothetical protein